MEAKHAKAEVEAEAVTPPGLPKEALEVEEASLSQQVAQLDQKSRAFREQAEELDRQRHQAIGGLVTVRRLLGKDQFGNELAEPENTENGSGPA